jgi:hypothetical protein
MNLAQVPEDAYLVQAMDIIRPSRPSWTAHRKIGWIIGPDQCGLAPIAP